MNPQECQLALRLAHLRWGKGFDGPWGVEILSESFRRLPVAEALQLAANTARQVI